MDGVARGLVVLACLQVLAPVVQVEEGAVHEHGAAGQTLAYRGLQLDEVVGEHVDVGDPGGARVQDEVAGAQVEQVVVGVVGLEKGAHGGCFLAGERRVRIPFGA